MSVDQLRQAAGTEAEQDPARRLMGALNGRRDEVKKLLPPDISVDLFIGVCKTAVLNDPRLLQVDPRSFFIACMRAAKDGLLIDGKEAVINVYNTKQKNERGKEVWVPTAQYLPMVGGLVKKLYASGNITYIDAAAVYEGDEFEYTRGDDVRLVHRPTMSDNPGPIIAAYCVIKLASGEVKREVMPRRDIEKVRDASQNPKGPGWTDWYDQFAIKSVLKRAYKQLPHTREVEAIIASDNEAMGFVAQPAAQPAAIEQKGPSPLTASIAASIMEAKIDEVEALAQEIEALPDEEQRAVLRSQLTARTGALRGQEAEKVDDPIQTREDLR